jgi:hypothetical protein
MEFDDEAMIFPWVDDPVDPIGEEDLWFTEEVEDTEEDEEDESLDPVS